LLTDVAQSDSDAYQERVNISLFWVGDRGVCVCTKIQEPKHTRVQYEYLRVFRNLKLE
jgi:hypothetical protein